MVVYGLLGGVWGDCEACVEVSMESSLFFSVYIKFCSVEDVGDFQNYVLIGY